MISISILGSTGSIGTQTLNVCRDLDIKVDAISAFSNIDLLEKQAREFDVKLVGVYDKAKAYELRKRLSDTDIKVVPGEEGNIAVATYETSDTVVTAMSGMIGLVPTISAIKAKKRIALANKETLVCAGHIIMDLAKEYGVDILPVDSEHSAIFQCLNGKQDNKIKKIILTASGGPFFGKTIEQLSDIKKEDALKHPNWSMGNKITIDSATLMNKGLEMIEAKWLFDVSLDDIEVVIHRESIVHSAVEFEDDSVIAQLGVPQMYLPIKYALTYPQRVSSGNHNLSLFGKNLSFFEPDRKVFKALDICIKASKMGGLYPTVMNSANEEAVGLFLKDKIKFTEITDFVDKALDEIKPDFDIFSVDSILKTDKITREFINDLI